MFYLALAIVCSIGTAALLKLVEIRELRRMPALAVNYAAGFALALAIARGTVVQLEPAAALLGVVTGALFLAGYFVFGAAIRQAGVGLAAAVMRLSVAVPVLGSWALFGEAPSTVQVLGLALAAGAFVLLARPAGPASGVAHGSIRPAAVLLLLFAAGGCVDLAMKVFARIFGRSVGEPAFLVVVFGIAAALATALVVLKGRRPLVARAELGLGCAIGLLNYGSADFLLRAAAVMPAALVFPTLAVSVMAGTAALGLLVWGERLSRVNVAGLFLAAAALVLLWGVGGAAE